MIRNLTAVFWKQGKDTFKNKTIFIQFVLFPILTIIMERVVKIEGMPEHFFTNLFATMYIGMAPLTSMAAIISEEKEKNTLRVLLMSNVKPFEYLLGTGAYVWLVCMAGAGVFCLTGHYTGETASAFLGIMALGILVSILIGAAIGTWSRSQMMATSVTVPVMMIVSFLPMLAMFNGTIEKIAKITYSQQINYLINTVENLKLSVENGVVILMNILFALFFFYYAYRKCGLE